MGTNYYLETDFCRCCGKPKVEIHLGKTSNNTFIFHRQKGLQTVENFKCIAELGIVKNEYGEVLSSQQFSNLIDDCIHEFLDNDFC